VKKYKLTLLNFIYQLNISFCLSITLLITSPAEANWRPRPNRLLKCWSDLPGYKEFVTEKWQSFRIDGWGGYVLKEKLKLIKGCQKLWHQSHTQNLEGKIQSVKDRISCLDVKAEDHDLEEEELKEIHLLSAEVLSLSKLHAGIQWQKSRLNGSVKATPTPNSFMVSCLQDGVQMLFFLLMLIGSKLKGLKVCVRRF